MTRSAGAVFNTIGFGVSGETENKGKYNETFDVTHGRHHGVAVARRMHGHGDQTLEWWTLYIKKKSLAYDQCFDEIRAQDPEMAKNDKTQAELLEFLYRVRPCMERKGY